MAPLFLAMMLLGCASEPAPDTRRAETRTSQSRQRQSNKLLENVVARLRTLPEAVQLDLQPPTVVLDARTSADGQDVLAAVRRRPGSALEEPPNWLVVPAGNARFKSVGVRPGDTLKYFMVLDRESRERYEQTGEVDMYVMDSVDLEVAQVLDNNSLLFVGGLQAENPEPTRLEVWRNDDVRMREIDTRLSRYRERRDPPLGWQPTGDEVALGQMVERLNQWYRQGANQAQADWAPPALLKTLDETLLDNEKLAEYLSEGELSEGAYRPHEARLLQQATWARGVSDWARGDAPERLAQATALFDWVTRNLQLVGATEAAPHLVWEALLHGRASAAQRAWVLAQLCRQLGLTAGVALVGVEGGERVLSVVLIDDQLRVFDPALGLPIFGADGETPAKLAELSEQDGLLRQFDLPDAAYPLTTEAIRSAKLGVVAEPFSLSRRAAELERRLTGADALVLAVDADADAQRLSAATRGEAEVVLWDFPFQTHLDKLTAKQSTRSREVWRFLPYAWRPALWKARALHFRGRIETPGAATRDVLAEETDDLRSAMRLYLDPSVRPSDTRLDKVGSNMKREVYASAKARATLWAGVIAYEKGEFANAVNWLSNKTLVRQEDESLRGGVLYNLARAYEQLDKPETAIRLLEGDRSEQRHGNRLRARRLNAEAGASPAEAAAGATEEPAP